MTKGSCKSLSHSLEFGDLFVPRIDTLAQLLNLHLFVADLCFQFELSLTKCVLGRVFCLQALLELIDVILGLLLLGFEFGI